MNLLGYKSLEEVHHAAAAATSSKIHPPVDQPDHELCLFLLMVWWLDQQFFYPPSHSPGQVDLFIARAELSTLLKRQVLSRPGSTSFLIS